MLIAMERLNSIDMAYVNRPTRIEHCASRRLCNTGPGTSVTREAFADVVLAVFSAETAAGVTRSVLQQTIRGHVRYG